jgi:homoserine dehydrogenase
VLLGELRGLVKKATMKRAVLVDNTSSEDIARRYPDFLEAGVCIVTPNKKAFSGEQGLYNRILSACASAGSRVLHEATVGAGLPIVSPLKDLVATGDKVTKIEGVFSGTMSYIFNHFSTNQPGGPTFSSVVKIAREKGFTEPHPGDDLNGADVARKLTILARSVPTLTHALPSGYRSVQTTSLIPPELEDKSPDGDDFIARLPEFDFRFDKLRNEAEAKGEVLRYVGVIDVGSGVIKASLERYPITHPFAASLGGSDNIIMFHTERYGARPLIVQGAGAGAAVTAMGILSDLFKLVD